MRRTAEWGPPAHAPTERQTDFVGRRQLAAGRCEQELRYTDSEQQENGLSRHDAKVDHLHVDFALVLVTVTVIVMVLVRSLHGALESVRIGVRVDAA